MSLHSKIEPAAINIERDITKCLTCHGFFTTLSIDSKIIRLVLNKTPKISITTLNLI